MAVAFRFNLDSVLKHRKRLEEIAQREFAEAQAAVDVVLRRLEAMYQRLDEVREEIAWTEKQGAKTKLAEIVEMEGFLGGQKIRIEHTRAEARVLLEKAEIKQEALIAAAQEKKILVKLRDKRLMEHRERLARLEAKDLDDQTQMRQAWGKR